MSEVRLLGGPRDGVVQVAWWRPPHELRFPVAPEIRWSDDRSVCARNPDRLLYERMVQLGPPHPGAPKYVPAIDSWGRPLYQYIRTEKG